jgi:purine-binding chemotaxis protein CheW
VSAAGTTQAGDDNEADAAALRILEERAAQLAHNPETMSDAGLDVMLFRLGDEQYGVEMSALRATQPARGLTPVPSTPPHIAGVINVRGEIVTVLDLASILGLVRPPEEEQSYILLADGPEGQVGLLVDEVIGMHQVASEDIGAGLSGSGYTAGIAETRFSLLHLGQLFAKDSLVVDNDAAPAEGEGIGA